MVSMLELAIKKGADYIFVLEDDTPVLGNLPQALLDCHDLYGAEKQMVCRWDFWYKEVEARRRLNSHTRSRVMYPPGNLQGVFGLMMRTAVWTKVAKWAREHYDKAPADWLIGRYLFRENYRLAILPPTMNMYHKPGSNKRASSLASVKKEQTWDDCDQEKAADHPFKWEKGYRLHWVGGPQYFLEIPFFDSNGEDVGVPRDAGAMDQAGHMIVCEKTKQCAAVNKNGWMKKAVSIEKVTTPSTRGGLYLLVQDEEKARAVYQHFKAKCPRSLLRRWG